MGCIDVRDFVLGTIGRLAGVKFEAWPPPDGWQEVIITWQTMLDHADYRPNAIEQWCVDNVKKRWHLHGYQQTEGFAFRFEDPLEALMFALKWGNDRDLRDQ